MAAVSACEEEHGIFGGGRAAATVSIVIASRTATLSGKLNLPC